MQITAIVLGSLTIIVGIGSIIANLIIASRTIAANKQIAKDNAGKNRIIYGIAIERVEEGNETSKRAINDKLNTGNYTILSSFQDIGRYTQTVYTLGKIHP